MADQSSKTTPEAAPVYTFNDQLLFTPAPAASRPTYSFTEAASSVAPSPQSMRPPIGPEIGPDPRNANATVKMPDPPAMEGACGIHFDFNHGYRIKFPEGPRRYRVKVYDDDADLQMAEHLANGGEWVIGERKYFIRYRLEIFDEETHELLLEHTFDCEGKRVYIVIPDGGLGDNLAWLPYAEEFRVKYRAKVTCICGEWLIRIVAKNYPEITFIPVAQAPLLEEGYASYFCAIFPKERKTWRPSDHQNFGMQGSVAKLLGLEPHPCKVRFTLDAPRTIKEHYVCISTMATNPAKYWNYPDGWNTLLRWLKAKGYRVMVIDRDPELAFAGKTYHVPSEAEDCTGIKPITERMALLQHADFFIGLPSGLSWLAWNCNVPVVMLSGFTVEGSEFPTPYRVTNFNYCHGCWNDSNLFFDMTAPVWCPRHLHTPREIECTRVITPKMVMAAISRIPGILPDPETKEK